MDTATPRRRRAPNRNISERERALHALAGKSFPRPGDTGFFFRRNTPEGSEPPGEVAHGVVLVTRLWDGGDSVSTRFVGTAAGRQYGLLHTWKRIGDLGNGLYFKEGLGLVHFTQNFGVTPRG